MAVVTTSPYFVRVCAPKSPVVHGVSADVFEELRETYTGHASHVTCIANGARAVFSGSASGRVASWNPKTAKELWRWKLPQHHASLEAALGASAASNWATKQQQTLVVRDLLPVGNVLVVRTTCAGAAVGGTPAAQNSAGAPMGGVEPDTEEADGPAQGNAGGGHEADGGGDAQATDHGGVLAGFVAAHRHDDDDEGFTPNEGGEDMGRFEHFDDGTDEEDEAEDHMMAHLLGVEPPTGPPLPGFLRTFSADDGKELPGCPFFERREYIGRTTRVIFVPYDRHEIAKPSVAVPVDSPPAASRLYSSSLGVVVVGCDDGSVEVWDASGAPSQWQLRWTGRVELTAPGIEADRTRAVALDAQHDDHAGIAVLRVVEGCLVAASRQAVRVWDLESLLGHRSSKPSTPRMLAWLRPGCDMWHQRPVTDATVAEGLLYVVPASTVFCVSNC